MSVWPEHKLAIDLLDYAAFTYNHYSGHIVDVDWQSVDVLLRRSDVNPSPTAFADFRVILSGFIAAENAEKNKSTTT